MLLLMWCLPNDCWKSQDSSSDMANFCRAALNKEITKRKATGVPYKHPKISKTRHIWNQNKSNKSKFDAEIEHILHKALVVGLVCA